MQAMINMTEFTLAGSFKSSYIMSRKMEDGKIAIPYVNASINCAVFDLLDLVLLRLFPKGCKSQSMGFIRILSDFGLEVLIDWQSGSGKDIFEKSKRNLSFDIYGTPDRVKDAFHFLKGLDEEKSYPKVNWFFHTSDMKLEHVSYSLKEEIICVPEAYPWIDDVDEFIDNFMKANDNVLVLYGPPGTGKTSFLKYIITKTNSNVYTTFDESVMDSDSLYTKFMSQIDSKFLILEDADLLLQSRESHGNKTMKKLLSASDGLIKLEDKKFIFTANIESLGDIDAALLRPGRCYKAVNFRRLTIKEALNLADKLGKNLNTEKLEISLAEVYGERNQMKQKRLGFI
jgi:hypothetical protein